MDRKHAIVACERAGEFMRACREDPKAGPTGAMRDAHEDCVSACVDLADCKATPARAGADNPRDNGWIPSLDGTIDDPYVRDCNDGVAKPYLPFFTSKGAANSWCARVDAIAVGCERRDAARIAADVGVELLEC